MPETLSPLNDADARWRILAQLKTLTNDRAGIFEGYFGCGNCHICDANIPLGVTKTASGVEWHRDLVHFVEIHNLVPPTEVLQDIETRYERIIRKETEMSEDGAKRLKTK